MNDVGGRIAEIREVLGFTQRELADGINSNQGMISKLEKGAQKLDWERAVLIADFLGVSLDRLRARPSRKKARQRSVEAG